MRGMGLKCGWILALTDRVQLIPKGRLKPRVPLLGQITTLGIECYYGAIEWNRGVLT